MSEIKIALTLFQKPPFWGSLKEIARYAVKFVYIL